MGNSPSIFCYGEVLWDLFPDGKKIGGAPLNVAQRLQSFGYTPFLVSAVGNDANGTAIKAFFKKQNLSSTYLQENPTHPTGIVKVNLDDKGVATYEIASSVAWDHISLPEIHPSTTRIDLLIFGSLALRNQVSKDTLFQLLQKADYKVFDLNLRPPFYSYQVIVDLMKVADFIKFNAEELDEMMHYFAMNTSTLEEKIAALAKRTQTSTICVSLGAEGAVLYREGNFYRVKGFAVEVVDTVGAGDSFLATLLDGILQRKGTQQLLRRACAVGALVSAQAGANPVIAEEKIQQLIASQPS